MKGQLQDKVAIVTGGGTGIGAAISLKFAHESAKVVVNGLRNDPITNVVAAIRQGGGDAIPFAGDAPSMSKRGRVSMPRLPSTGVSTSW